MSHSENKDVIDAYDDPQATYLANFRIRAHFSQDFIPAKLAHKCLDTLHVEAATAA